MSLHAQDSTVTTRTQVDADDARTIMAAGCLRQAPDQTFTLMGAVTAAGEDLESKTRVSTDVDRDDVEVKTERVRRSTAATGRSAPRAS